MIRLQHFLFTAAFLLLSNTWAAAAESSADDQRLAVPDQAARDKSNKMIQEIFGARITAAKTPLEFSQLAMELSKVATDSSDDASARFVLLQTSVDMATKAGDYRVAFVAAEEVANHYQVDRFVVLPRVLVNLAPRATAKNYQEAKLFYTALISEAISADRLDVATTLCEQLSSLTQRLGDAPAKKEVLARTTEVQGLKKSAAELAAATQALEANPNDPAANEALGKLYLEKGKWEQAFAKLALANDAGYKTLAAKATAKLEGLPEQLELADASWKLAETSRGALQARLQQLAGHYYNKALKQATGLDKAKIEIRLKELTKKANPLLETPGFVRHISDPYAKRAELAQQDFGHTEPPLAVPGGTQAAPAQPGEALTLKIVSARWGGGSNWLDVTEKAQAAYAKNPGTWVWATTDYQKADPTPGWRKKLEVHYEINNKPYKASVNEGGAFKPSLILKGMREQMP